MDSYLLVLFDHREDRMMDPAPTFSGTFETIRVGCREAWPAIEAGTDAPPMGWAIGGNDDFVTKVRERLRGDPSMLAIVLAVSEVTGVSEEAIRSANRARWCARPRQLVIYLMKELCSKATGSSIGREMRRDRRTVSNAIETMGWLIENDSKWRELHYQARRAVSGYPCYPHYPRNSFSGNGAGKA